MLKTIRQLNFGWILIILGAGGILSGMSMTTPSEGGRTLLCFTEGCIYLQGISNIILGCLVIIFGLLLILRKRFQ